MSIIKTESEHRLSIAQRSIAKAKTPSQAFAIAHAAGWDAANRACRAAGRKAWSREDAYIAAATMARLLGPEEQQS